MTADNTNPKAPSTPATPDRNNDGKTDQNTGK